MGSAFLEGLQKAQMQFGSFQLAENGKRRSRRFQSSGFGGPTNSTTTTCSDLGSYVYSHPAEVLEIVLENVLCFLTSSSDRNAASLVCKSWYRVEGLTRLDVNIVNAYAVLPSRVINRFPRVTSLSIRGFPGWSSSQGKKRASLFSSWVYPMTEAYRGLEKVYLRRMYVTNDGLGVLAQSFPHLKELVLVSCKGFGTRGLATVARGCSQIRVFELIKSVVDAKDIVDWISCFPESTSCLESFIFDCVYFPINFVALEQLVTRSPSLKKIISSCNVSIPKLPRIMDLAPQVTHLGRGLVPSISDLNYCLIQFLESGIETDMVVDDDVVEEDPDYANFAAGIVACKSLECLSGLNRECLQAIVPVCGNNLKTLDLGSIFSCIRAEEILHCHKVQSLRVHDSIRDEGLKAVAATCKDLRQFRLKERKKDLSFVREEDPSFISEAGLLAIFKRCRKLQYIKYDGHGMTNASLLAISKNCPDLRVLCIVDRGRSQERYQENDSPKKPLDIGIGAIVKKCKKITQLNVLGLITDRGFQYIGEYGKSLQSLRIFFEKDSDMGLKYVLEGCSKLQKLEVMKCPFADWGCYTSEDVIAGSPCYYSMNTFFQIGFGGVTGAGCGKIARLLLDIFGLEAHVMLSPYQQPQTHGCMRIYLKR